jgi:hypothetical protein
MYEYIGREFILNTYVVRAEKTVKGVRDSNRLTCCV